MRSLVLGLSALGLVAFIVTGCGDSEGDDEGGSAGRSSSGASGEASAGKGGSAGSASGGSSSGAGGTPSTGGSAQGGKGGGAQAGTPSTGGSSSAAGDNGGGGEPATGGTGAFVDCDDRKVTCEMGPPKCGANQTASVDGLCYGECVLVSRCACKTAAECPNQNEYTCWMQQHCGPFVK
jgi:hypothetical protein